MIIYRFRNHSYTSSFSPLARLNFAAQESGGERASPTASVVHTSLEVQTSLNFIANMMGKRAAAVTYTSETTASTKPRTHNLLRRGILKIAAMNFHSSFSRHTVVVVSALLLLAASRLLAVTGYESPSLSRANHADRPFQKSLPESLIRPVITSAISNSKWRRYSSTSISIPASADFGGNNRTDLVVRKAASPEPKSTRTSSKVNAATFNLIKAIAGSGVLALPSGLAAMSDYEGSLVSAILLMTGLGVVSAYTFALYGRLVHASQARSLGELWKKTKGENSSWFVSATSLTFCLGGLLSYSILLGDVAQSLAQTVGLNVGRQFWILLLTGTILYPLCNLRSLLALAPLSVTGVVAVFITTLFIMWRCPLVNAASPYAPDGGILLETLSALQVPKFRTMNKGFTSPSSLIIFGMAVSSYLGHFSAPDFYHSVSQTEALPGVGVNPKVAGSTKDKNNSAVLKDYFKVTAGGFFAALCMNCLIMAFGFLTFGGNSMGVILNNYSTKDVGATICRLLMAISIIGGYPFLVSACRGEILALWKLRTRRLEVPENLEKQVTSALLLCLTMASMVVSNAGFVIGLSGAVMGSVIGYIFPCLLFLSSTGTGTKLTSSSSSPPMNMSARLERMLCRILISFGVVAALAGGAVSIINNYFPHLLM